MFCCTITGRRSAGRGGGCGGWARGIGDVGGRGGSVPGLGEKRMRRVSTDRLVWTGTGWGCWPAVEENVEIPEKMEKIIKKLILKIFPNK